jgi:hypothetical protein
VTVLERCLQERGQLILVDVPRAISVHFLKQVAETVQPNLLFLQCEKKKKQPTKKQTNKQTYKFSDHIFVSQVRGISLRRGEGIFFQQSNGIFDLEQKKRIAESEIDAAYH